MRGTHAVILALVCLAAYANGFHHSYNLDDVHYVLDNPAIRSLANLPSFFTDPSTLTVYRANVDYRPLLTLSYAINHAMGGYDTWWWHLTQVLLHYLCVLGLYLLCRRVLLMSAERSVTGEGGVVPLAAATLFALHPTGSGVVNYFSARSSLLTAAFLLPALLLYLRPVDGTAATRTPAGSLLLYVMALFTKVEAVGCLGAFFAHEVWQRSREHPEDSFFGSLARAMDGRTLRRLGPFVAATALYFVLRSVLMAPYEFDESRRATGVTSYDYLLTQTVVWWVYVRQWLAPVGLVADDGTFHVCRSLVESPVPLALAGWFAVVVTLLASWRRAPEASFLAIAALALLSPTSSIAPLAEMRNEHRPYLPMAVLSLVLVVPLARAALRRSAGNGPLRALFGTAFLSICLAFFGMTRERNLVYRDGVSYWGDVLAAAPSARAHNNYGLAILARGDADGAHRHFVEAVELAPNWFPATVNLGLSWARRGRRDLARPYLDRAVASDAYSGTALTWRGEFLLEEGAWEAAAADFAASAPRSVDNYRNFKGAATAAAGRASAADTRKYVDLCRDLDPARLGSDIVAVATPFFADTAHAEAGLAFFEGLATAMPDVWWVHANLGRLAERLGRRDQARQALATADGLKNARPAGGRDGRSSPGGGPTRP